jgi:hypothetical protein
MLFVFAAGRRAGLARSDSAGLRAAVFVVRVVLEVFLRAALTRRTVLLPAVPRFFFAAARRTVLLPVFLESCLDFIATGQSSHQSIRWLAAKD